MLAESSPAFPSSLAFTGGSPQRNITTESTAHGAQAQATRAAGSRALASARTLMLQPSPCRHVCRGCQIQRNPASATRLTTPPTTSTSVAPTKLAIANCTPANEAPQTSTAGHTPASPRQPAIATTIHAGTSSEKNGNCRPAIAEIACSSRPVTFASVTIGVPSPPKATGAVFAMSARHAASSAGKPAPTMSAAEIATGAPNPATPSRNAPNENATRSAWSRWSTVRPITDRFITSSAPASTESR